MEPPSRSTLLAADPGLAERMGNEDLPEYQISTPAEPCYVHPLLLPAIELVERIRRSDARSRSRHLNRHQKIDMSQHAIRVSLGSANRAISLMDAVIKACISRGMPVSIDGLRLRVGTYPRAARVRITERELKTVGSTDGLCSLDIGTNQHVRYHPTGQLIIHVESVVTDRKVPDTDGGKLEVRLNKVMKHIILATAENVYWFDDLERWKRERDASIESREAAAEEERLAQAERERQAAEERARVDALLRSANQWHQAQIVRDYVAAHESAQTQDPPKIAWREWALSVAEQIENDRPDAL